MLIIVFTAVAILAWLGAAIFVNTRRAARAGARAASSPPPAAAAGSVPDGVLGEVAAPDAVTPGADIAAEAMLWLQQLDEGA